MNKANETTTAIDSPQFSFADVQKFTGLSKGDLQAYGRYIEPAEKAIGTGNRSKYSARNVFSFTVIDHLSRLRIPASVAGKWSTTTLVMGDVAYAWLIVPAVDKRNPPIAHPYFYEYGDDPRWKARDEAILGTGRSEHHENFSDYVVGLMGQGMTFAIIPTGVIFEKVCRVTGTRVEE